MALISCKSLVAMGITGCYGKSIVAMDVSGASESHCLVGMSLAVLKNQ
jgi:hypothetical protein